MELNNVIASITTNGDEPLRLCVSVRGMLGVLARRLLLTIAIFRASFAAA